jgi:hypothetical protein
MMVKIKSSLKSFDALRGIADIIGTLFMVDVTNKSNNYLLLLN